MSFWKRLSEIIGKKEELGKELETKTFRENARVKQKGEKGRGTLYLKVNNYTYLVTPERSELAKRLSLEEGDVVLLTAEKIVEKM